MQQRNQGRGLRVAKGTAAWRMVWRGQRAVGRLTHHTEQGQIGLKQVQEEGRRANGESALTRCIPCAIPGVKQGRGAGAWKNVLFKERSGGRETKSGSDRFCERWRLGSGEGMSCAQAAQGVAPGAGWAAPSLPRRASAVGIGLGKKGGGNQRVGGLERCRTWVGLCLRAPRPLPVGARACVSQAKQQASRQPRAEAEHRTELGVPETRNSVTWARAHEWPGNRQHGAVLAWEAAAPPH